MSAWLQTMGADPATVYWALGVFSVITFIASLLLLPILVARLPEAYFTHAHRQQLARSGKHPLARFLIVTLKNTLGLLLILAGIAMLVLPGQGVLTIIVGLAVMDFPGKFHLEQRLVSLPRVLDSLNWIRRKAGRPVLLAPTTTT